MAGKTSAWLGQDSPAPQQVMVLPGVYVGPDMVRHNAPGGTKLDNFLYRPRLGGPKIGHSFAVTTT